MALPATRMEFRLTISDSERGVDAVRALVVARHPSETLDHVALRVLAYAALYEDGLEMGPGLSDGEAADLERRDARGDLVTWVSCGRVPWEKLRKALSLTSGVRGRVCAVFAGERRYAELSAEIAALPRPPKDLARAEAWVVSPELVASLASEARRQSWAVTLVGGHAYVDADGRSFDGAVELRGWT